MQFCSGALWRRRFFRLRYRGWSGEHRSSLDFEDLARWDVAYAAARVAVASGVKPPHSKSGLRLGASGNGLFLRRRRGGGLGSQFLPVAAFFEAGVNGADLRFFLHDERRAALRARLRNRHEWRRKIAI